MKYIFIRGLSTGLILQLAIGPVFIFIMNTVLQYGIPNGIIATMGVTLADYLYILLAIAGAGRLLEIKRINVLSAITGSLVLLIFGLLMIKTGTGYAYYNDQRTTDSLNIFSAAFVLTISSPLTILFWSGIFTVKVYEYSLNRGELALFGLSAGLATPLFLSSSVIMLSLIKVMLPLVIIRLLNTITGAILICYGIIRIIKIIKKQNKAPRLP